MFTMQIVIIDKDNPFSQVVDLSSLELGKYKISKFITDINGDEIVDLCSFEAVVD